MKIRSGGTIGHNKDQTARHMITSLPDNCMRLFSGFDFIYFSKAIQKERALRANKTGYENMAFAIFLVFIPQK